MSEAKVMLVSSDPSLIETCGEVIASIGNLDPIVLSRSEEADIYLRHERLALVLLHVAGRAGAEQASRLLRRIGSLQRPVAISGYTTLQHADRPIQSNRAAE